jgi:tetratricopeptide (TPR) repeat protein
MTLEEATNLAVKYHEAGQFAHAEQIYRRILEQAPNHPNTLHLLGVLAHQTGKTKEGIALLERALSSGRNPTYLANLGELLRCNEELERSIACCKEAISIAPSLPSGYHNLAVSLQQADRLDEALAAARRGAELAPGSAASHRILASVLHMLDRLPEAATEIAVALKTNPNDAASWGQLGAYEEEVGRFEHAIAAYEKAAALNPHSRSFPFQLARLLRLRGRHGKALPIFQRLLQTGPATDDLQLQIAGCLEGLNRFDEAIAICKAVLAHSPGDTIAHSIIGIARFQNAQLEEAEAGLRDAITSADHANFHSNLAVVLVRMGRLDEALDEINRAIELAPDAIEIQFSKSLILLFMGRMEEAWPLFETRWKHPRMDAWRHVTDKPVWDGSPLAGKTILLYAEQGMGDTMQYGRYATLVAARGGRVVMEVQRGLREVIASIRGVERVVFRGEPTGHFDTLCPLLSLPGVFHTNLQNIPADVPYIHIDPAKIERWKSIIGDAAGKLKVGIAWMGGDFLRENHLRSSSLAQFAPLAAVPSVRLYSLQKGPEAAEALRPPAGMELVNLDPMIQTFADTGAAIANLDLVIAVDTAVIHLAGAMGRPVWALLSRNTAHQWMTERDDTPWYPTMRLIRQAKLGNWPGTIERVCEELRRKVESAK